MADGGWRELWNINGWDIGNDDLIPFVIYFSVVFCCFSATHFLGVGWGQSSKCIKRDVRVKLDMAGMKILMNRKITYSPAPELILAARYRVDISNTS